MQLDKNQQNQQLFQEAVRQVQNTIQGQLPDFIKNALNSQNNEAYERRMGFAGYRLPGR